MGNHPRYSLIKKQFGERPLTTLSLMAEFFGNMLYHYGLVIWGLHFVIMRTCFLIPSLDAFFTRVFCDAVCVALDAPIARKTQ